jgi:predicted RNA binding protein YcfA (HicA-like mRNA interferase family)
MRIPRQIDGHELAKALEQYGYQITRQSGSHIRMTTTLHGEHHITIPAHKALKIGTLSGILSEIANHLKIEKTNLIGSLFGN